MKRCGWNINRLQVPDGLHAMVRARHLEVVDDDLADLAASVEITRTHTEYARQGGATVYGPVARIPFPERLSLTQSTFFVDITSPLSQVRRSGGQIGFASHRADRLRRSSARQFL